MKGGSISSGESLFGIGGFRLSDWEARSKTDKDSFVDLFNKKANEESLNERWGGCPWIWDLERGLVKLGNRKQGVLCLHEETRVKWLKELTTVLSTHAAWKEEAGLSGSVNYSVEKGSDHTSILIRTGEVNCNTDGVVYVSNILFY
jgi:hypothetical protein